MINHTGSIFRILDFFYMVIINVSLLNIINNKKVCKMKTKRGIFPLLFVSESRDSIFIYFKFEIFWFENLNIDKMKYIMYFIVYDIKIMRKTLKQSQ